MKIAYLTAGAAGMYCGSCLHDNTLAAALGRLGVDIQLIPTYTPIRTDEEDVSIDRVFFGGVTLYLEQRFPTFRWLPASLRRLLDHPRLLRWVTSHGLTVDPHQLGALTVSMLKGEHGGQRREVRRLCAWLATAVQPDLVVLANILIGGSIDAIKRRLGVPVLVTLQGEDLFLDQLPAPYRSRALAEIRGLAHEVDGFLVHSRYYADFVVEYFGIAPQKLHIVPLGIDTRDFPAARDEAGTEPRGRAAPERKIGYLARLAPEKGLHVLVEAFIELHELPGMADVQLGIAGWLGASHRRYAEHLFQRLQDAGLGDAFHYAGSVNRKEKIEFLQTLSVFSVPAIYRDPKGLYALEALAAGVPVVAPDHGALPELIAATGGGWLVPPNDPHALASTLHDLLVDPRALAERGQKGKRVVHQTRNAEAMARAALEVYKRCTFR